MSTILLKELSEKHYSRQIAGDIGEICEPLRMYGITHFMYARFFFDGSGYHLTDSWDAYYHHCKKQYLIGPPVPPKVSDSKFFYLPAMALDANYSPAYHDWQSLFNLGQPIYFIERQTTYFDLYIFGSTPNNETIINFYVNNIDMLEKFKFYFKDKASKIIAKANKNKIILPQEMCASFSQTKNSMIENETKKQEFFDKLKIKNYIISGTNSDLSLSRREMDVIKQLMKGFTFKEIGKNLEISARTVETHLNNVKYKLNINKKSDIIKVVTDLNLINL